MLKRIKRFVVTCALVVVFYDEYQLEKQMLRNVKHVAFFLIMSKPMYNMEYGLIDEKIKFP